MRRWVVAVMMLVGSLGCDYEACADAEASFVLPAPGDTVELVVHACGPRRNGIDLFLALDADRPPAETLAVEVDGVGIYLQARDGGWTSDDSSSTASAADCDPGRRITIRRLDSDDTVMISGTIAVGLSAPKRRTCSADIVVTPLE